MENVSSVTVRGTRGRGGLVHELEDGAVQQDEGDADGGGGLEGAEQDLGADDGGFQVVDLEGDVGQAVDGAGDRRAGLVGRVGCRFGNRVVSKNWICFRPYGLPRPLRRSSRVTWAQAPDLRSVPIPADWQGRLVGPAAAGGQR